MIASIFRFHWLADVDDRSCPKPSALISPAAGGDVLRSSRTANPRKTRLPNRA